jgi:hypothetical protein
MHRMKIGLVAAAILLVFTVGVHAVITRDLKESVMGDVETQVTRAERMHQSIARLEALDFTNLVTGLSHRASVVAVFDKQDEAAKRQDAFDQCNALNMLLQKAARKADIVAILDSSGKVIARDLNRNANYGDDMRTKYPAVDSALRGEPAKDIWALSGRMTRVAVAPVTAPEGTIRGALLVGYVLNARDARLKRDLLGSEVAYFHDGKVHTTSFVSEGSGEDAKEDANKTSALDAVLFQSGDKPGLQAIQKGEATELFHFTLDGHDYAAIAAPLLGNAFDKTSGVLVLTSISAQMDRVSGIGLKVIGFGVLAILVALGAAVMTAVRFIKPLDKIELGVAEIINGNIDYTFRPVGPDFEGLSNSLNVMMARLLGRDEPSEDAVEEESDEAQRWRSDQMQVEEIAQAAAGDVSRDPAVQALAQEPEATYFARVFGEYVAALKGQNQPTTGITVQAFTTKLRLIEGGLKQKWKCRGVRFRVVTHGDQVTLRPVPIY